MNAAEQSAKDDGAERAKGCVEAVAPDGKTKIWVRPPRGPGPWFRVKHPMYGHRLVRAATEDEAVRAFFEEFNPGMAHDADWCRQMMRLNGGRVARLPGADPAPAEKPAPARKGEK